jgi:8-oxo-dGTP pyrophosphatase MutT (NUDIX family)
MDGAECNAPARAGTAHLAVRSDRGQYNARMPDTHWTRALTQEAIAARLAASVPPPGPDERHAVRLQPGARITEAAVLVPLVNRPEGVQVLLTQRTSHLKDHPSQVSFPGGRVDAGDADRVATALREAEEEVGLAASRIRVLGSLPEYDIPSGFRVSPIVGWIEPPLDLGSLTLDPFEVAAAFEAPLAVLLDPARVQRREVRFNGRHRHYVAIPWEGRYIWGATAGMLLSLARALADG